MSQLRLSCSEIHQLPASRYVTLTSFALACWPVMHGWDRARDVIVMSLATPSIIHYVRAENVSSEDFAPCSKPSVSNKPTLKKLRILPSTSSTNCRYNIFKNYM